MGNILSIKNLSVDLKEHSLVKNISFNIDEGDVVLLSGVNGIGKSTILKSILCLETEEKTISGEIINRSFGNILTLSAAELQRYRSSIAYIQQRDEYSEMGNIQVRDIISESREAHAGKMLSYSEVNDLIDEWIPRGSDNSRIFDAKSKPAKCSGGEQRLLSVLSVIATHPQAELMISHCRIFPFITREIKLSFDGISEVEEPYVCHSCFGESDEKGFYVQ